VKRDVVRRWISTIVVWLCGLSVVVALVPLAFIATSHPERSRRAAGCEG